jgi:hypothetical protein
VLITRRPEVQVLSFPLVVVGARLVERLVVVQVATGSNPVDHPNIAAHSGGFRLTCSTGSCNPVSMNELRVFEWPSAGTRYRVGVEG